MQGMLIKPSHRHLLLLCFDIIKKVAKFPNVKNKAHCKRFPKYSDPPDFTLAHIVPRRGVSSREPFADRSVKTDASAMPYQVLAPRIACKITNFSGTPKQFFILFSSLSAALQFHGTTRVSQ